MKITLPVAAAKLREANKILIASHVNPDGDAIGSTLAMLQVLRSMGKNVAAYIDDKIPTNFSFMPYAEEIRQPRKDEKFDADLLLILDTAPDRIGTIKNLTDAPILNIDHHITNKGDEYDLYVDATAAAACEIIFELFKELNAEITKDIAVCIFTGLATDSGFFKYSNTKPSTLHAAAELVEAGVEPNLISEQLEKRTFKEIQIMSAALQTTKLFYGGKVAGMFIDEKLYRQVETTEGLIDLIRVIDSADVAFLITEKEKNVCRVSMRSKGVEVSSIARKLGGGGHVRAAGCTIYEDMDTAKNILIREIGEFMLENGYLSTSEFENRAEISLTELNFENE